MKNRRGSRDGIGKTTEKSNGPGSLTRIHKKKEKKMMKKKNLMRLGMGGGGGGLSLEAFANAKAKDNHYNPAVIKKQREFYKNAKYVSKYKKSLKQQSNQSDPPTTKKSPEYENGIGETSKMESGIKKKKDSAHSLNELYEKKRAIEEKARAEKEAIIKAKKDERERAETRRKALRENMFKRTKSGQPVMKYRIEHLLQTLQGSTT